MIIAIEGPDGVGKTTIAKELAARLGFSYIEKPLHHVFSNERSYQEIKDRLIAIRDKRLSAWFYGLNYLFCEKEFENENIVCDRYVFSNFAWIYDETNKHIFKALIDTISEPFLTFVLTIDKEVAANRIKARSENDKDVWKTEYFDKYIGSLHELLKVSGFEYHEIDRTNQTVEDTVLKMLEIYEAEKKRNNR